MFKQKCPCCGAAIPSPLQHTRDHFIPHFLGGRATPNNTWPMHRTCNNRKGRRLPNASETMRFSQYKGYCSK